MGVDGGLVSVDGVGATQFQPGGDAEMHLPMRDVTKKRETSKSTEASDFVVADK